MRSRNNQLALFRLKVGLLLRQYRERMLLMIAENKQAGLDYKAIKSMRKDPTSKWNLEKEALNKKIKSTVAGLLNRIHIEAYMQGLRK